MRQLLPIMLGRLERTVGDNPIADFPFVEQGEKGRQPWHGPAPPPQRPIHIQEHAPDLIKQNAVGHRKSPFMHHESPVTRDW